MMRIRHQRCQKRYPKEEEKMKEKKETSNQNLMARLRGTGSVVRDAESLGLCRRWDDILVSILDKRLEWLAESAASPRG
jgi:hypothetical protein